jgi:hypothetical protein
VPEPAWFTGGRRSVAGAAGGRGVPAEPGAVVDGGDLDGVILEGVAVVVGAAHNCSILPVARRFFATTPLMCAVLTTYRNKQ